MSPEIAVEHRSYGSRHVADLPQKEAVETHHTVILVADDDATSRNLVCSVLQRDGYAVLSAADVLQGLELARQFAGAIDLVITEMRMPGPHAIDLCTRLRNERPGIKALVISSLNTKRISDCDGCLTALPEPSEGHILRAIVRAILAGSVQQPMHWLPTDPLR